MGKAAQEGLQVFYNTRQARLLTGTGAWSQRFESVPRHTACSLYTPVDMAQKGPTATLNPPDEKCLHKFNTAKTTRSITPYGLELMPS